MEQASPRTIAGGDRLATSAILNITREQSLARLNNARRQVRELRERWHDSLTLEGLSLAEDYLKGRLEVAVEVEVARALNARAIHCGDEIRPIVYRLKISSPQRADLVAERETQPFDVHRRKCWDEQFVLIENVEIVEGPKGVLPAVVGLQVPDDLRAVGMGPLHFARQLGFKRLAIYTSRKIRVLGVSLTDRRRREGDSDVVECGSYAVDCIADYAGELQGHWIGEVRKLYLPKIRFGSDKELLATPEGEFSGGMFKLNQVTFGPFDL